jgi:hypothetical protein
MFVISLTRTWSVLPMVKQQQSRVDLSSPGLTRCLGMDLLSFHLYLPSHSFSLSLSRVLVLALIWFWMSIMKSFLWGVVGEVSLLLLRRGRFRVLEVIPVHLSLLPLVESYSCWVFSGPLPPILVALEVVPSFLADKVWGSLFHLFHSYGNDVWLSRPICCSSINPVSSSGLVLIRW